MIENHFGNLTAQYQVKDIIESLGKFRMQHVKDYNKAIANYRKVVADRIVKVKKELDANPDKVIRISANFGLSVPTNKCAQYDDMISIFGRMQDPTIKLTMHEADAIFSDNWAWVGSAKLLNSSYAAGAETFYNEANTSFMSFALTNDINT